MKKTGFVLCAAPKLPLLTACFVYALLDFWSRYSNANTLSFEALTYEPGGPGRVFALEENDVVDRLTVLEDITSGKLRWSEAAGLKQVARNIDFDEETKHQYLFSDYGNSTVEGTNW